MPLCLTHYAALDQLELGRSELLAFGASMSRLLNGVVLNTLASLTGQVGLSPLIPLKRAAKILESDQIADKNDLCGG